MLKKALINKEDINGELTCITLSKLPMVRDDIGTARYINYNSFFSDEKGHFIATLNALSLCETKYALICDSDDPFPLNLIYPDKGLIYGDFLVSNKTELFYYKSFQWSFEKNLRHYWMIHKPIINVKNALKVMRAIKPIDIHFHFLLYFMIAYCFGSDYDNRLEVWWIKNDEGMHKYAHSLKHKTQNWLSNNADSYKKIILQ